METVKIHKNICIKSFELFKRRTKMNKDSSYFNACDHWPWRKVKVISTNCRQIFVLNNIYAMKEANDIDISSKSKVTSFRKAWIFVHFWAALNYSCKYVCTLWQFSHVNHILLNKYWPFPCQWTKGQSHTRGSKLVFWLIFANFD